MALKKFHLLKDRFVFDDYEDGLYYDIVPILRNPGDENAMNARIDTANKKLKETNPSNQNFKVTAVLTQDQLQKMQSKYYVQFGAKSYLLLYIPNFDGKTIPQNAWTSQGDGGLFCNQNTGVFYTNWTSNGLGFRFRRVNKTEVDAYVDPNAPAPVGGDTDTGGDTTVPPVTVPSGEVIIHMKCPKCGEIIF